MLKNRSFAAQFTDNYTQQATFQKYQSQMPAQTQLLYLNFISLNKKGRKKSMESSTKINRSGDQGRRGSQAKEPLGNISQLIKNIEQASYLCKPKSRTTRETLLQKKKSYAQSIRQKNKTLTSMKQNQRKSKIKSHNQSVTQRDQFNLTPAKGKVQTQYRQVNNGYKSQKKQNNNSDVFKQSDNRHNVMDMLPVQMTAKTQRNVVTSRISNIVNSARGPTQSSNIKNKCSNKQNNKEYFPATNSSKKNPPILLSKCTSNVQIFDIKNTINDLSNDNQKSNGLALSNSVSRRVKHIKKPKDSLNSMKETLVSEFQEESSFALHQLSINQEMTEQAHVSFVGVSQFHQQFQGISRIRLTKNKKQKCQIVQLPTLYPKKLQLQSKIYSETVNHLDQYQKRRVLEQRQIVILSKQNGTFKKQLANSRKQNSTMRRQLQSCRKYMLQLQEKTKHLIQDHQLSLLTLKQQQSGNIQMTVNATLKTNEKSIRTTQIDEGSCGLEKILERTQQQLFSLKSNNKALQLKVYILEKRMANEEELSRKRIALQISNWRQKYNKLRNQHLRTKNAITNPFTNNDCSFTMDISRDQQ